MDGHIWTALCCTMDGHGRMDGIVLLCCRFWRCTQLPRFTLTLTATHSHTHTLTHSHIHTVTERETEREFLEWVRVNESSALRTFLAMTPRGCP